MYKDAGNWTIHVNRYRTNNFALGFDFYIMYTQPLVEVQAYVVQFSFLFFNVTITKWAQWT